MIIKKLIKILFLAVLFSTSFFVYASNDVQITDNTNFELHTFDTAVMTTIVASAGGQVTNFDVQSNYVDITLDNLSLVTFNTAVGGQYLKIIKQSGSDNYTVSPACPTTTVTLTGTGAAVVLRLEILMTNTCGVTPVCGDAICNGGETCSSCHADCGSCGGGGGGGGGSYTPPVNGVCGTADHGSFYYNAPTINLCSAGIASIVSGSGPWTWICNGIYGGSNSSVCTTNKATSLPPGCISNLGYSTTTGLPCGSETVTTTTSVTTQEIEIICPNGNTMSSNCTIAPTTTPIIQPEKCEPYLLKYIKLGAKNDPVEVKKLQKFLNDYEGFDLVVDGIYGPLSFAAVEKFQTKYAKDILAPWNIIKPSGWVYKTTIKKVNELYCSREKEVF